MHASWCCAKEANTRNNTSSFPQTESLLFDYIQRAKRTSMQNDKVVTPHC